MTNLIVIVNRQQIIVMQPVQYILNVMYCWTIVFFFPAFRSINIVHIYIHLSVRYIICLDLNNKSSINLQMSSVQMR